MNHKVHVFARGCLTLKLSASWKTVILSPVGFELPLVAIPSTVPVSAVVAASGASTAAMMGNN